MKNSIPSDVWERKKALIAKLYKDEEWPLKQVIKQIRSADFNPSETQLRSRLKKWRVTKPSRQTRKKSNASQPEAIEDSSSQESTSPHMNVSVSPKTQVPRSEKPQMALSVAEQEWYMNNGVYAKQPDFPAAVHFTGQDGPESWSSGTMHQTPLSPSSQHRHSSIGSPSMVLIPSGNPYDPANMSPLLDGPLVDSTSSMASSFPDTPYTASAEPCLQAPVPTTTAATAATSISWSMPQWFTQSTTMPFYTTAPLSPPIDPVMQLMAPHPPTSLYPPHTSPAPSFTHQHLPELYDVAKPVKRSLSAPFVSNTAGGDPGATQSCRPQTSSETHPSLPPKMTSLIPPPSPFLPHGQHPVMCAPIYPYTGPEYLAHKPPSIGF
ncbi:hypothetical protein FE257_004973 [Aspergillus nanangensis]|uniref:Clr5 domain-containing protein n=1 Tax=Aspergillus nanangensis TaxID=2582783 RepID=A0AAD4CBN8_ASPNN|nr:hypothetical protein FE257_004973 [Aspergillus nanangensis]